MSVAIPILPGGPGLAAPEEASAKASSGARSQVGQRARARAHRGVERLSFAVAPALVAACSFSVGILLAWLWWTPPAQLLVGLAALALLTLVSALQATRVSLLGVAALFTVLGALAAEVEPAVPPQTELALLADGVERPITGRVVRIEPPRQSSYTAFFGHKTHEENTQRIDLRVMTVSGAKVDGGLRLSLYAPLDRLLPALRCGAGVRALVAMHPEQRYLDPGVWDTSAYLHEQGIGAMGSTASEKVTILATGSASQGLGGLLGGSPGASVGERASSTLERVVCELHTLQTRASARVVGLASTPLEQRLPPLLRLNEIDASMLTAMLTGDRTYLEHQTRIGFERTGSFHLLVVSGMHLAIFASVIFLVATWLRVGKVSTTALTLVASLGYALFTGFGEPVRRSLAMVALFLVGRLIFRQRYALHALGLASLGLMAASPRALAGSSLQMTLLSVIAIGGIAAPLWERSLGPYLQATRDLWLIAEDVAMPPKVAQFRVTLRLVLERLARPLSRVRVGRWALGWRLARQGVPRALRLGLQALELLLLSVVVELVMALPMAIYFHRITVLSLPVNFLIVPFLGLLLPAALATFAVLLAWPPAAVVPSAAAAALLHIVAAMVTFFSAMRAGNFRIPPPPPLRVAAWVVLLALSVWLVRRGRWSSRLGVAALAGSAILAVAPRPIVHRPGTLEVISIDVGQGDAELVITSDGRTLLVDAGGIAGERPDRSFDIGEDVVSPTLWSLGIARLDAVAISHAHTDHIGGISAILANFRPRQLWVGTNPRSAEYGAILDQAQAMGVPVVRHFAGDAWSLGAAQVQALWPSASYVPKETPTNNDSLVLRIAYQGRSALLEGDAEAPAEAAMVAAGLQHADLLKVGHHGSRSSSIPPLLAAVRPEYASISVGRRNYYGHPRHETIEALAAAGARTYRTDRLGETTFYLDGRSGVTAETWAESRDASVFR